MTFYGDRCSKWKLWAVGSLLVASGAVRASDQFLVCGWTSHNLVRLTAEGEVVHAFIPPSSGGLRNPHDFIFGADGRLYVASTGTNSILRYDGQTGSFLDVFVAAGSGGLSAPTTLIFHSSGDLLVGSYNTDRILRFDGESGAFSGVFAGGPAELEGPEQMAYGPDGDLYLVCGLSSSVLRFDADTGAFKGVFVSSGSGGLANPHALRFESDGDLLVSSFNNRNVLRFSGVDGAFLEELVSPGSGGLGSAHGLETLGTADLLVCSFSTSRVLRYDVSTGEFRGVFSDTDVGIGSPILIRRLDTGIDCDRVMRLRARCRNSSVIAKLRSSLSAGDEVVVELGDDRQILTVGNNGRGRTKFRNPSGAQRVYVVECPHTDAQVDCP